MYRYRHQILEAQNWLCGGPAVIVHTRNIIACKGRRWVVVQKGQRCAYCHSMNSLTVNHKLARAFEGTSTRRNLQILYKPCECQKAAENAYLLALLQTVMGRNELWRQSTWAITYSLYALHCRSYTFGKHQKLWGQLYQAPVRLTREVVIVNESAGPINCSSLSCLIYYPVAPHSLMLSVAAAWERYFMCSAHATATGILALEYVEELAYEATRTMLLNLQ